MYYVYIVTTLSHRVLYTGVTGDLQKRIREHQAELIEGFTKRYHVHHLVFFEAFQHVTDAIAREKQIKGWRREKKLRLIEEQNPSWADLLE